MNRPRLFLSAVSEELCSARQAVAATVRTLGFDPVSQDDFPTGHGELRKWLREQIDSCEGLIQLIGHSYGDDFAKIESRGTATSVFQEMSRILVEQGVDEAIAYVAAQRLSILKTVHARAAAARERNRADLQPLLKAAGLHEAKGQAPEARTLYTDILAAEPEWPEALHAAFWFHSDQGDIACVRTTLADARRDYEEAHRMAQRLIADDPSNTAWQRALSISFNKLGDVAVAQDKLEEAVRAYGDGLGIAKKLAAGDPSNTAWQRAPAPIRSYPLVPI
jgi:tetratricopeptide (TPR) repeat protein